MLSANIQVFDCYVEKKNLLLCWLWPNNWWGWCHTECGITYLAQHGSVGSARSQCICQTLYQRVCKLWRWR